MIHRNDEEAPRIRARQVIIFSGMRPMALRLARWLLRSMPTVRPARSRGKQRYANHEGKSPIAAFEIGAGFVRIWFTGNTQPYRYTSEVAALTRRARAGRGLATFISRHRDELRFTRD
jgi:hypothetical protein